MTTSTITPKSDAKSERDKLCKIVGKKGLADVLHRLPSAAVIQVEPMLQFKSALPYKVNIGTRQDTPVWALLGHAKSPDRAPDLLFYIGHGDADLRGAGQFPTLGKIKMVDPFKVFRIKTVDTLGPDKKKCRYLVDQKRGQFKSLIYWYLLNEAAERGGEFHVPKTILQYFVAALKDMKQLSAVPETRASPPVAAEEIEASSMLSAQPNPKKANKNPEHEAPKETDVREHEPTWWAEGADGEEEADQDEDDHEQMRLSKEASPTSPIQNGGEVPRLTSNASEDCATPVNHSRAMSESATTEQKTKRKRTLDDAELNNDDIQAKSCKFKISTDQPGATQGSNIKVQPSSPLFVGDSGNDHPSLDQSGIDPSTSKSPTTSTNPDCPVKPRSAQFLKFSFFDSLRMACEQHIERRIKASQLRDRVEIIETEYEKVLIERLDAEDKLAESDQIMEKMAECIAQAQGF